jgi:hypothetical protein
MTNERNIKDTPAAATYWNGMHDCAAGTEHDFSFETEAAADAFVAGIQYVNDSAVTPSAPFFLDGEWHVSVIDNES